MYVLQMYTGILNIFVILEMYDKLQYNCFVLDWLILAIVLLYVSQHFLKYYCKPFTQDDLFSVLVQWRLCGSLKTLFLKCIFMCNEF